jgi:hypothetical protein
MPVVFVFLFHLQTVCEVKTQGGDHMVFQAIAAYYSLTPWPSGHLATHAHSFLLFSFCLQFSSLKSFSTSSSRISLGLQNVLLPSGLISEMSHINRHYPCKIHFNIIQRSVSMSSMWLLYFRFPSKYSTCICHLFHCCYMFGPSTSPWFDDIDNINVVSIMWLPITQFC